MCIDNPSDVYIHNAVQKAIDYIIRKEGYMTYTVHKRIINEKGDSFLGAHCEVNIKGKTVEGDNKTNVFIKILNPDHQITFIDVSQAYSSELYVYRELFNIYATLQEEFKVPSSERFTTIKYYYGCSQGVIAMENMREHGFLTPHRTETLSLDFVKLALIELAKFHAMSFVLKHKRPAYFDKNIKNIRYPFQYNEGWDSFIASLTDKAMNFMDKDIEVRLTTFLKDFTKRYTMHIEDKDTIRCLCHGDYRSSNILMKIVDGVILKVIPVDYQIIYYGSPVLDFLYYIYVTTDREMRNIHLPNLKDLYHNTLKKFLEYFNMDIEVVYPREEFERALIDKLDYGLMIALVATPILFAVDDLQDIPAIILSKQQANDECKRRILGSIEEYIEWGYL